VPLTSSGSIAENAKPASDEDAGFLLSAVRQGGKPPAPLIAGVGLKASFTVFE
jgi:hypothetical protein